MSYLYSVKRRSNTLFNCQGTVKNENVWKCMVLWNLRKCSENDTKKRQIELDLSILHKNDFFDDIKFLHICSSKKVYFFRLL